MNCKGILELPDFSDANFISVNGAERDLCKRIIGFNRRFDVFRIVGSFAWTERSWVCSREQFRLILEDFFISTFYKECLSCSTEFHAESHIFRIHSKFHCPIGVASFGTFIKFNMKGAT